MPIDLEQCLLAAWRRHNEISLLLVNSIPEDGFAAVPLASRGRTVAVQFLHMHGVRNAWLEYHETGKRPKAPRRADDSPPGAKALSKALAESGSAVEAYLLQAIRGDSPIRMFGKDPVRWMLYLIAHESHHRGQILLALKQAGKRMPPKIALQGLWGKWIFGK